MELKKAYYARPISVDNTPQAERDINLIRAMGFEPYPVGEDKQKALAEYARLKENSLDPMEAFDKYVRECDAVFFRAFPDGSIGAGVMRELTTAALYTIPVVEIPRQLQRRGLSVEDTREMLMELGQR